MSEVDLLDPNAPPVVTVDWATGKVSVVPRTVVEVVGLPVELDESPES